MTPRSSWLHGAALPAVIAAGAILRFAALGRHSFWLDEAYGADVARQPLATLLAGRVGDGHTPPLYYVLLHLWMRLGDGDAWLRALSATLSVAILVLAAWWLRRRFGARIALLGTALLAISPHQVYFAQEARMYSLAALLAVAVFMLEERASRDRRAVIQLGLVAIGVAGFYTHLYLVFAIVGSALFRAWRLARGGAAGDSWRRLALAHAGMAALSAPWIVVVANLAASGGQQFRQSLLGVPPYAWFRFLHGYAVVPVTTVLKADPQGAFLRAWPWVAVAFGLGALGLAGLWRARRGESAGGDSVRHAACVVSVMFALPFAVSLVVPMYGERYLGIVQPLAMLLLVAGLLGLPRRLAAGALAALLGVGALGSARWTLGLGGAKEEWRGVVASLAGRAAAGEIVVLDPWFNSWPVRHYLRRDDLALRTTTSADIVTELGECREGRPWPVGRMRVVVSHSPRTAADWRAGLAPCAVLAEVSEYSAGVGITVLRFEALRESGAASP